MSKRFIIFVIVVVLAGLGLVAYLRQEDTPGSIPLKEKKVAAKYAELYGKPTQPPAPAALTPIDLSHPLRLAIGGLGLADENENQKLGDLVTVKLAGVPGFDLVERQSLSAVLHELNLNWSGFVRAKDAVRAGKLLKADWFLLGTEAKLNGTNSIVVRVVDARTGILCDAGVVPADKLLTQVAADLVAFLRGSRQNAAHPKPQTYLAFGAFEDLSVNNRQADFPNQLRSYLTAAYRGSGVILLEREYVETLLREVHLDMAGLTEESWSNPPPVMQSAYWLVDGQYQSYETTNFQIELNLEIQRAFGKTFQRQLRGLPGEEIGRRVKAAIDEVMNQNASYIFPTRRTEARMQMEIGRELTSWHGAMGHRDFDLVVVGSNWYGNPGSDSHWSDSQLAAKLKRRLEDAIGAFETVLLLEPNNREAKMYLAALDRNTLNLHPEDACNYYRQIIDDPKQDKWSQLAQQALVETFLWFGPQEKLRWLQMAAGQTTNTTAVAFYNARAEAAQNEVIMNSGDSTEAEALAWKGLLASFQSYKSLLQGNGGHSSEDMGLDDYIAVCKWDRATAARKLAAMLPKMQNEAPGLEPYLLATVLTYQLDTNTPLVAEFEETLDHCVELPGRVLNPPEFWDKIRWSVYDWCLEKTNLSLAIKLLESEKRVAASRKVESLEFDDQEKIKLAYAYLAARRWQKALDVFESFGSRPVRAEGDGPWGRAFQPILTDKMAAFCREKLGTRDVQDPRKFDVGKPVLCLCSPATFTADQDGLWVGIGGRLLRLDFELRTNLSVKLPMDPSVPITALGPTSSSIWIGTHGAGLVEFDKGSRQCRHLTEADGLLMNDIASLEISGDSLWVGYGGATGGGLGRMDLPSGKVNSFTPSINANAVVSTGEPPPRDAIGKIVGRADGDLWMSVNHAVRQFHVVSGIWETLPKVDCDWMTCFCADSKYLVEGGGINLIEIGVQDKFDRDAPTNDPHRTNMVLSSAELNRLQQELRTNASNRYVCSISGGSLRRGAVAVQSLRDYRWHTLEDADGFPNPPTTMTLDGNNLWVGGEGVIALVDLEKNKVQKFCHIKAASVDKIQIAGGYLWAQFDWQLYRVPLSAVQ